MTGDAPATPVIEVDDTVRIDGETGLWVIEEVIDGGRRYEATRTTNSRGPACRTTRVVLATFDGGRVRFVRKGNADEDANQELFAYLDGRGVR